MWRHLATAPGPWGHLSISNQLANTLKPSLPKSGKWHGNTCLPLFGFPFVLATCQFGSFCSLIRKSKQIINFHKLYAIPISGSSSGCSSPSVSVELSVSGWGPCPWDSGLIARLSLFAAFPAVRRCSFYIPLINVNGRRTLTYWALFYIPLDVSNGNSVG